MTEINPFIDFLCSIFVMWVVGELLWPSRFWFNLFHAKEKQVTMTKKIGEGK